MKVFSHVQFYLSFGKPFIIPLFILIISLIITLLGGYVIQTHITKMSYHQFEQQVQQFKQIIINRLQAYEQILQSQVALLTTFPSLKNQDWHYYVRHSHFSTYPSLCAIGFHQSIKSTTQIHLKSQGAYSFPLIYSESLSDQCKPQLDFNTFNHFNHQKIMAQGRDTGKLTLINEQLLKKNKPVSIIIMYLPVYQKNQPVQNVRQRQSALLGLVTIWFQIEKFIQTLVKQPNHFGIEIYAQPQMKTESLLYPLILEQNHRNVQFTKVISLPVGKQIWMIRCYSLSHSNSHISYITQLVLLTGLLISLLLFKIVWSQTAARQINSRLQAEIHTCTSLENKLRYREELLRLVIDSIPQFIFWKDLKNTYLGCNKKFALIAGVNLPKEMIGKTDQELPWSQGNKSFLFLTSLEIENEQPEYHQIETLYHDDQQKWFDMNRIPLHDANDQLMGHLVTFEDITAQKKASFELQQNRIELQQFKATLDATLDSVLMFEAKTLKIFYVNQGAIYHLGYSQSELLQMTPMDFETKYTTIQSYMALMTPLIKDLQPAVTFESLHRHKEGTLIPVEVFLQYIQINGQTSRFVATIRDITERKQAEIKLQQAKEEAEKAKVAIEQANIELKQFKTTLDMTLDIVFIRDAETLKFTYANQGATKHLGYTLKEFLKMTPLDINPRLTANDLHQRLAPLTQGTQSFATFESVNQHKNGTLIPVEVFIQYIQAPGQTSRFISIARDITERKQTEKTLLEAKEIAEKARIEAEIANRAKSTFLANMSHELRTPLNGILGYTQILNRDKSLTLKQQNAIHIIQRSSDYLLTLINDILDLSKIEAGKVEIFPTDFQFNDFIQGITQLFQMRAEQKGISFFYKPLSLLPVAVYGDEKRLRQVLINLLSNAVKFTHQGQVDFKVGYQDNKMRFQVEDTGIGIAAEELEKIFIPFQQVGVQSRQIEGTGLGLSITKKLVEMMAGQLHVESQLGQGSLFWLELNLPEVPTLQKSDANEQPLIIGFQGPTRTILVVDHRWENRSILVNLLQPLGFKILEAQNGQECLDQVYKAPPDLILTDLMMPIMDGFETTRQLRKTFTPKKLPIIAVSASVFELDQKECLKAGCNDFIAKPIRVEYLLEKIKKYLNLQWVYEQEDPQIKEETEQSMTQTIGLSSEQAHILFDLAMKGDIGGIIEEIDQLEQSNKELLPFIKKIRQFARNFDEEQICHLIEPYLNE